MEYLTILADNKKAIIDKQVMINCPFLEQFSHDPEIKTITVDRDYDRVLEVLNYIKYEDPKILSDRGKDEVRLWYETPNLVLESNFVLTVYDTKFYTNKKTLSKSLYYDNVLNHFDASNVGILEMNPNAFRNILSHSKKFEPLY